MATTTWKILGHVNPGAATETTLYTCPSATQCVGKVTATNQGAAGATIRIAIRPAGAARDATMYLTYEEMLPVGTPASVYTFACGQTDVVSVQASTATCNFVAMGQETA